MLSKLQLKRINSPLISYKYLDLKVDNIDVPSRKISGYAAAFNNIDAADDMIIKGAFAKSIQERGPDAENGNNIAFCYQHDITKVLGRVTLLKEDDYGLYFEAIISDTALGNETLKQLADGSLKMFSIGYNYVWDMLEYDPDMGEYGCFICKELYLAEFSVVTLACNSMAQFEGFKAEDIADRRLALSIELDEALRGLKRERSFKLRQLISESLALAAVEPIESVKERMKDATKHKSLDWGAIAQNF